MRFFIPLCAVLLMSGSVAASNIKVIVNDTPISEFDVASRAKLLMLQRVGRVGNLSPELEKTAMEELIDERIKMQEIVKQEINVSEENVQEALAHLEQQNGMPSGGFQKMLEEQGIPYQTLVNQTKANLGWLQVIQKSGRRVHVLPADIKARQKIIRQELMREAVSFAEIVVKTEEEALTILQQLQGGSDFGTMVALHSVSDSRANGGRVIEVNPDYYGEEVAEIFNEMQAGQLSRPIKVKDGYAIILMMKKRESVTGDTITIWELAQAIMPNDSIVLPLLEQTIQNGCETFTEIVQEDALPGSFQRGQVSPGQLPKELSPILKDAEFKTVIGPIQTPDGLLYFMKCSQSEERVMPTDDVLKMQIENEKLDLLSRQLLSEIKRDTVIEYR